MPPVPHVSLFRNSAFRAQRNPRISKVVLGLLPSRRPRPSRRAWPATDPRARVTDADLGRAGRADLVSLGHVDLDALAREVAGSGRRPVGRTGRRCCFPGRSPVSISVGSSRGLSSSRAARRPSGVDRDSPLRFLAEEFVTEEVEFLAQREVFSLGLASARLRARQCALERSRDP
jgi:hypothetical protein